MWPLLSQEDVGETGQLEREGFRRILLSSLGLSRSQARTQAVRHLLDSFLAMEEDPVHYERLVSDLNWIKNGVRPQCPSVVRVEVGGGLWRVHPPQVESWKAKPQNRGPVRYREMVEELTRRAH